MKILFLSLLLLSLVGCEKNVSDLVVDSEDENWHLKSQKVEMDFVLRNTGDERIKGHCRFVITLQLDQFEVFALGQIAGTGTVDELSEVIESAGGAEDVNLLIRALKKYFEEDWSDNNSVEYMSMEEGDSSPGVYETSVTRWIDLRPLESKRLKISADVPSHNLARKASVKAVEVGRNP